MAVSTTLQKTVVTLKLDDGVTSTGAQKTVSVGLGNINKAAFDADKVWNIVVRLVQCLSKDLYDIVKTDTSSIDENP